MAGSTVELAIRGENVQRVYGWYRTGMFEVNRRYQRKLVWTIEEKRSFIDSILQGFPVPLILVAEYSKEGQDRYEIIDGMQRLNALTSFIEQDFAVRSAYFDLDTMAETKSIVDRKLIVQREPRLTRDECVRIASYTLPLSVYKFDDEADVDEVFRRINANGKHLSRQELRVAGNVSLFATLVRRLSSRVRGDSSLSDVLPLSQMKVLSLSGRDLEYGIDVDHVFWVEQGIITKEQLRDSRDEELVADTLGYMLLDPKPASSNEILNGFYGRRVSEKEDSRADDLELAIKKVGEGKLTEQYLAVYDLLREAIRLSGKKFNVLMFTDAGPRVPRYFQVVFLALYELIVVEEKVAKSVAALAKKLDGIGAHIPIGGGGRWSAKDRTNSVHSVVGILRSSFKKRATTDPALGSWTTEFENLLTQSTAEQAAFDFKQGLHRLDASNVIDPGMIAKVVKTLAAIANKARDSVGYVVLGVADSEVHSKKIDGIYSSKSVKFGNFFVSGVDGEIAAHYKGSDDYLKRLVAQIKAQQAPAEFLNQVVRDLRLVSYHGKEVVILRAQALEDPVPFEKKYYERHGSEVMEVDDVAPLFRRFLTPP